MGRGAPSSKAGSPALPSRSRLEELVGAKQEARWRRSTAASMPDPTTNSITIVYSIVVTPTDAIIYRDRMENIDIIRLRELIMSLLGNTGDVTDITVTGGGSGTVQQSDTSASNTATSTSSSGSINFIPVVVAGIAAVVIIIVVVALVLVRRNSTPSGFVLGASRLDAGEDWANPIYTAAERNVAFDNPIYDRLENLA